MDLSGYRAKIFHNGYFVDALPLRQTFLEAKDDVVDKFSEAYQIVWTRQNGATVIHKQHSYDVRTVWISRLDSNGKPVLD